LLAVDTVLSFVGCVEAVGPRTSDVVTTTGHSPLGTEVARNDDVVADVGTT
jgi:hypothetical protein